MSNGSNKTVLVTGVTGSQGGATARHLLQHGWQVRGLTRNLEGKQAKVMAGLGVQLVKGDMGDRATIQAALEGAYGVYAVTDFFRNGVEGEIRHGKLIAELAGQAGVQHFVLASVIAADRNTGVPHFDSKGEIEKEVQRLNLPATVLRPCIFMEDLTEMKYFPPAGWGMMQKIIGPDKPIYWISVNDIGAVAAAAFADPNAFIGKTIELAGDSQSIGAAREIFKQVDGKKPFKIAMPVWLFSRMVSKELAMMWTWLGKNEFSIDINAVRILHPGLQDMKSWLEEKRSGKK